MSALDVVLFVLAVLPATLTTALVVMTYKEQRHVSASPQIEAHYSRPKGESADTGIATSEVHGLPAPGHARAQVADRAPSASVAGRADDDSQLWALAHVLPMVPESMQPSCRGQARCRCNEPTAAADGQDEQGLEALVTAEHALDQAIESLRRADECVRGSDSFSDLDELASSWLLASQSAVKIAELRRGF